MKKLVGLLLGSMLLVGVILGVIWLVGAFVEWACLDFGRFALVIGILSYATYRLIKRELDN